MEEAECREATHFARQTALIFLSIQILECDIATADGHFRSESLEDRLGLDAMGTPVHTDHVEGGGVAAAAAATHEPLGTVELLSAAWTQESARTTGAEHRGRAIGEQTGRVAATARYLHEGEYKDV